MSKDGKHIMMVQERSHIYGFLAHLYSKEPSQEFIQSVKDRHFLSLLKELGIELGNNFEDTPLGELVDELAVEYTRLFIGPGKHIYPYESAYCNGKGGVFGNTTFDIKNLIESCGLRYKSDFHGDFDHVSIELEFMEKITEAETEARKEKDSKKIIEFLKFERQFLDEHLVRWIPEFADNVIQQANLNFYREMAKLTREYILFEACEIKDLISKSEFNKEVIYNV